MTASAVKAIIAGIKALISAIAAGGWESGVIPKFSLCSDGVDWFNARGQFQDASYVPAAGILFSLIGGNDRTIDHVGIVESVTNGVVNTIEGNSGDVCTRRSYRKV